MRDTPEDFLNQQRARSDFETYTLAELQHRKFEPLRETVTGLVFEGCTILAAKPKMKKTFLMTQIGLDVVDGVETLGGRGTTKTDVLFLGLEDSDRSMQWRVTKFLGAQRQSWPPGFHVVHRWPRGKDGIDCLRIWLTAHRSVGFVVLDVLARILPAPDPKKRESYAQDYDAVVALTDLAREFGIALVVIHHLRKSDSDDPLDTISGTLGIVGAADGGFAMQKGPAGVTFYGRHRFAPDVDQVMQFDEVSFHWSLLGDRGDVERSEQRRAILTILRQAKGPMHPKDIAEAVGANRNTIRSTLFRMRDDGDLVSSKDGYEAKL